MPSTQELFKQDLEDLHLVYDYDVDVGEGEHEKWRYEMYFQTFERIVYAIHGGPMAGRKNYQKAEYQCIRPGELWQCNWLEETGTICSAVFDLKQKTVSTVLGFSKGHWDYPKEAHGDKRNKEDFERWRKLAEIGKQTDRHMLSEQATVSEIFKGPGELVKIDPNWPTM